MIGSPEVQENLIQLRDQVKGEKWDKDMPPSAGYFGDWELLESIVFGPLAILTTYSAHDPFDARKASDMVGTVKSQKMLFLTEDILLIVDHM